MAFIESITERGVVPVIPPRANRRDSRTYDVHLYKERHLVECFMQYRRISSRFDKLAGAVYGISEFRCHNYWVTMKCQHNLVGYPWNSQSSYHKTITIQSRRRFANPRKYQSVKRSQVGNLWLLAIAFCTDKIGIQCNMPTTRFC